MSKTNIIIEKVQKNGILHSKEINSLGISREHIRNLVKSGLLLRIRRGLYSLPNAEISTYHSFAESAKIMPNGIICLLSALSFYELTTQNPYEVWMMIDKKRSPAWNDFPMRVVHTFSKETLMAGVEEHIIDGVEVKIYNPAKTIADCFKFRNKIGLDIAIESLKECLQKKLCTIGDIMKYARICRVSNIIRPYIEAMI